MLRRSVPFFNYSAVVGPLEQEILAAMQDVMRRGAYILQRDVAEFEATARQYLGAKHFYGVADGTNAIILALRASGIGPTDEVILPSHTYVATAAAVRQVGATPVLVECGEDHLVDPEAISLAVTSNTRAIIPVHLNGRVCAMRSIMKIADSRGIVVIEDAAQAFGAKYCGRAAGTFGVAGTFSFYPAKVLGCLGDGGGIAIEDDKVASQVFADRDHGRAADGSMVGWGSNCRLDNIQAAVLNVKFGRLEEDIARRRRIAAMYHEALSEIPELVLPPPPETGEDHFDTFQNYEMESDRRDELRAFLEENGVRTIIQWGGKAVHQIEALGFKSQLPRTDRLFTRCLMLPMNTGLSDDDVNYVCDAVRRFYGVSNEL